MTPTNPTPAATSIEMERFKVWARTEDYVVTEHPRCADAFEQANTDHAWEGWRAALAATPLVQEAEPLCGWKIDAAQQAQDSDGDPVTGVWELGCLDGDGNFYAIATVDTGNYDQPEAAEPLARAIIAKLTERATGVQATEVAPTQAPGAAVDAFWSGTLSDLNRPA